MRRVSSITSQAGLDFIVSFAVQGGEDFADESITLVRTHRYEFLMPPDQRGVSVSGIHIGEDREWLMEAAFSGERVALVTRNGRQVELDLTGVAQEEIERAMVIFLRMNFDRNFALTGATASKSAAQEVLLDLLESEDPKTVQYAIVEAEVSRELLADRLLDLAEHAQPSDFENGNLAMLSFFLLAHYRDRRALEPIVRFFEAAGEDPGGLSNEIALEDLKRILLSVADGNYAPIRRLIENERAGEWARAAGVDALVLAAAHDLLAADEVERILEEVMATIDPRPSRVWDALRFAAADLGSSRLLPRIEKGYAEGSIDPVGFSLTDMRKDVRRGRTKTLAALRTRYKEPFIEGVVEATLWWDFSGSTTPEDPSFDEEIAQPIVNPVRTGPKIGRNEPCPCGSGKKYKKCCGA